MPEASAAPGPYPDRTSDYAHARHAGNVGDVFKHLGLAALLGALRGAPPLYVETHAGDGLFSLGSVGEWTGGVQKLWALQENGGGERVGGALQVFLSAVRAHSSAGASRPERYPGSPLLARALLPANARLLLHELDPQAAAVLRRVLERPAPGEERQQAVAEVREQDGFAALPLTLAAAKGQPAVALIDPPYTGKQEWAQAARCLLESHAAHPEAALLLWYPLKALTRPRGLLAELQKAGLGGTLVELVSTPLRLKRERLAGSGLVFVRPPAGAVEELLRLLPIVGPPLATHGEWSAAQIGF
jgi:23S rRNA (adenine2030-N6)-methyltransferase